jgi:hypothetical protein
MSAGGLPGRVTWGPAGYASDGARLSRGRGGHAPGPVTVAGLCEQFAAVCESAVDPLEIASALEFEGVGDHAARARYGYPDVFTLAGDMYARVPRRPAEPEAPPDPWKASGLRLAVHGLLYALPGICFPAAIGLLAGHGVEATLIVALLVAWSAGQGLAYLGYIRLGRTASVDQTRVLLRVALAAGLAVVALVMTVTALLVHSSPPVAYFGVGEGAYMLGSGVLMVLGRELWLMVSLAPGVLYSAWFLALGRPARLEHVAWATLAATPVLTLALAFIYTRRTGQADGRLFVPAEWLGALPAVGFGLVAAGLLIFPVAAGPHGHGGLNVAALIAAVPLSLSMGAAEWSLLSYRQRTRRLLRASDQIGRFAAGARLILLAAVLEYLVAAAALVAAGVMVAAATGLAEPRWAYLPQLGAYLTLGVAIFVALLVQALGSRVVPLVACAAALAFEITYRDIGVLAQIEAASALLAVVAGYAAVELGRPARHAY